MIDFTEIQRVMDKPVWYVYNWPSSLSMDRVYTNCCLYAKVILTTEDKGKTCYIYGDREVEIYFTEEEAKARFFEIAKTIKSPATLSIVAKKNNIDLSEIEAELIRKNKEEYIIETRKQIKQLQKHLKKLMEDTE